MVKNCTHSLDIKAEFHYILHKTPFDGPSFRHAINPHLQDKLWLHRHGSHLGSRHLQLKLNFKSNEHEIHAVLVTVISPGPTF